MKDLSEDQERTREQLKKLHEAYRTCHTQLGQRERELVETEKARQRDANQGTRERKLISSAFYSLGMEYQASVANQRSMHARLMQLYALDTHPRFLSFWCATLFSFFQCSHVRPRGEQECRGSSRRSLVAQPAARRRCETVRDSMPQKHACMLHVTSQHECKSLVASL